MTLAGWAWDDRMLAVAQQTVAPGVALSFVILLFALGCIGLPVGVRALVRQRRAARSA